MGVADPAHRTHPGSSDLDHRQPARRSRFRVHQERLGRRHPAHVYALISDVSAISHWSPTADGVSYDDGAGPWVGAWFSGTNRRDGKQWTTRSQVVQADPGSAFGFVVGGAEEGIVRWNWTFRPQGRGSLVRQSWQLLRLDPVLGSTRADLDALRRYMAGSAETTLAALAQWIAELQPDAFSGSRS